MTRPARFTQAEIASVLRAAVKAGERRAIIIEPDGTIRIEPPMEPVAEDEEVVL